ncbi:MAG: hypothetical protein NVS4B6_22770 [Mycobacterium sp.]
MSDVAVLVIDMVNTDRHEDAEVLAPNVADIVNPLQKNMHAETVPAKNCLH